MGSVTFSLPVRPVVFRFVLAASFLAGNGREGPWPGRLCHTAKPQPGRLCHTAFSQPVAAVPHVAGDRRNQALFTEALSIFMQVRMKGVLSCGVSYDTNSVCVAMPSALAAVA